MKGDMAKKAEIRLVEAGQPVQSVSSLPAFHKIEGQPCHPVEIAQAKQAVAIIREALQPAKPERRGKALGFLLTLVAPTGMGQDERREWITAAQWALSDMPDDILTESVKLAAREIDHHMKALAAVERHAKPLLAERKSHLARAAAVANYTPPLPEPDYSDAADFSEILAEAGLSLNAYRKPMATVQDYMELGLSRDEAVEAVRQAGAA